MSAAEVVSPKRMRACCDKEVGTKDVSSLGTKDVGCGQEDTGFRLCRSDGAKERTDHGTGVASNKEKLAMKHMHLKTVITHGIQKNQKPRLKNKFASPTDRLLSPCSQKLNDHKSKLFVSKSNPTKLSFLRKKDIDGQLDSDEEYP